MSLWTDIWVDGEWPLGNWTIIREPIEGILSDAKAFAGACEAVATCEGVVSDEPVYPQEATP